MILTKEQCNVVDGIVERYRAHKKYSILCGYAGVGKTVCVKFIIEKLKTNFNIKEEDVCYCAYTGKAAQVLLKKGNKNVSTIHKLMYKSILKPDGLFYHKLVDSIPYKILVIDEISMLPLKMWNQLLTYNVYIIGLGDNFQLPPINPEEDNHLLDMPHFFLKQVMRQAQESDIVRISMDIREGRPLQIGQYNDVMILPKKYLNTGMLEWANQIIVATNKTRNEINQKMRDLKGYKSKIPQNGDKIICTKNYHEISSENNYALMNGTIGYIDNVFETFYSIPENIYKGNIDKQEVPYFIGNFTSDYNEKFLNINIEKSLLINGVPHFTPRQEYYLTSLRKKGKIPPAPLKFEYGYAITCWKSQGSEWDNVLIIEEKFPYDTITHQKFLYTAITRAAKKAVIITKE